jgi:Zn-dependent protease with chaperone function
MLLVAQVHFFSVFMLFSAFVHNKSLYNSFGFYGQYPILVGFILLNDLLQPLDSILTSAMNIMCRPYEYLADAYALNLEYGKELAEALIGVHTWKTSITIDADWSYPIPPVPSNSSGETACVGVHKSTARKENPVIQHHCLDSVRYLLSCIT